MNSTSATPQAEKGPHPAVWFCAQMNLILGDLLPLIMQQILVLGDRTLPFWNRISRARQRLARLLTNLAAGRLPRPHTPRPNHNSGPRPIAIPTRPGWLIHTIGYRAGGFASQLNHLLQTPETQALLATAPPAALASLGRTLRPLSRILGIIVPTTLLLSPRAIGGQLLPPRPKRPKPPKPAPLPKLLPLYPQARPRLILYPNPPRKIRPT